MTTKKLIGAAAFSLALAGGGVAGALIGAPGTSGAEEATTTTAGTPRAPGTEADASTTEPRGRRGAHLDAAATALGMTAEELRAELAAGKSVADVAAEQDVDVQAVIDAVVASAEGELVERVTAWVNGEGGNGFGGHHGGRGVRLEAAATVLGMTPDELHDALEVDGTTLADVADAEGVAVQALIDALVAEAQEHLDGAVADGRLTQEEADAKAAELEARITEMVNSELPGRGFRGRGGPGGRR